MAKPENQIVRLASEHVFNVFRQDEASTAVAFHGFKHSRDVVSAAKEIAKGSDLGAEDTRVVLLAAWFVDAAYAVAPGGPHRNGVELAREFLQRNRQPESLIEEVITCIEAAPSPAQGELRHEVLHDALHAPLAGKDFIRKVDLYRLDQADVSLDQYQQAMDTLAEDSALLKKTMVEQLYAGRAILNQRTRALRVTYDAFIYGLAFSLAAFAFVLIRR